MRRPYLVDIALRIAMRRVRSPETRGLELVGGTGPRRLNNLSSQLGLTGLHAFALNMRGQDRSLKVQNLGQEILLSTYIDDPRPSSGEELHLRADEGLVLRVKADIA